MTLPRKPLRRKGRSIRTDTKNARRKTILLGKFLGSLAKIQGLSGRRKEALSDFLEARGIKLEEYFQLVDLATGPMLEKYITELGGGNPTVAVLAREDAAFLKKLRHFVAILKKAGESGLL